MRLVWYPDVENIEINIWMRQVQEFNKCYYVPILSSWAVLTL
jgi:hypothetical protein